MTSFDFVIENLNNIGLVSIGSFLIYQKWIAGSSVVRKEIADEYKERNSQLKEDVTKLTEDVSKGRLETARLQGSLDELNKHNKILTELLQGKNPEIVALLATVSESNKLILEFMRKSDSKLDMQTDLLNMAHERYVKLDKIEHPELNSR